MPDEAILNFFNERKEAWFKKNSKASMDENALRALKDECDTVFSFENWLPNAAKRAGQMSMSTHPCTYSHPSARKNKNGYVTSVIAMAEKRNDGFIRCGNIDVEIDALGNAAVLDVHKFLNLVMADSKPLYDHIQNDTELSKTLLSINSMSYEDLKEGFLAMLQSAGSSVTSSKIKQIYFPVSNQYHLLSVVSNSGIIYHLREQVDLLRFSDQTKKARESKRNNEFDEDGFKEVFNITTIGYGGTKPQNISVLNNRFGGKAHLLSSIPPSLQKSKVRFPKKNFFGESFTLYDCNDVMEALQKLILINYNNVNIREGRDYRIQELLNRIVHKMWLVRSVSHKQFKEDQSKLKAHQKIWLCESESEQRESADEWMVTVIKEMSLWIFRTYKKKFGSKDKTLGDDFLKQIQKIIEDNREVLR